MLVLNLVDNKKDRKFRLFAKRKQQLIKKKDSFICCNEIFSIIEINRGVLLSKELTEYLNRYSGAVICSKELEKEERLKKYLFDPTLYYSRAYLSALTAYLKAKNESEICIYIDNFRFCREWVELANSCKTIIIVGSPNAELKRFCDFCRVELGLVPQVNDETLLTNNFLRINLNNINLSQGCITLSKNGIDIAIYPDARYFTETETVKKLKSYGISKNTACAATQVVPFKKIYFNSD